MSGVLGALGMAAIDTISDNVNNWLQGQRNVKNSKRLIDYQTDAYLRQQATLNQRLYPQMIASMRNAGVNPAMINGPMNQSAAMSSSSQNMAAPRMDAIGAAQAVSTLKLNSSQERLNNAQANSLNADAEVKRRDADLKDNELFTWFEDKALQWEKMISERTSNNANALVAEEKVNEIRKQIDVMDENINQMRESIENIKEGTKWIAPQARAVIYRNMKEGALLSGNESRASNSFYLQLEGMKAQNFKTSMEGNYIRLQQDALQFSFDLDKQFGKGERWLNLWNQSNDAFWGTFSAPMKMFNPKYLRR